ncbi:hypothetical protein Tco_1023810 [Tanacetum coccineum]
MYYHSDRPIRAKGKVGILGLLQWSQLAKVAQPDHQWYQVYHGECISRSYPFRMEVASHPRQKALALSHGIVRHPNYEEKRITSISSFERLCIVLDEHITEQAHEVRIFSCDIKNYLEECRRVEQTFDRDLAKQASDGALAREAYDVALAGEAYDVALAREAYDVTLAMEAYDVALGQSFPHAPSTGCGPDVCAIRTSYVSRQYTISDGDNALPLA